VILDSVARIITVPVAAAARAVDSSASGSASRWNAVGATSTGSATSVPSTVVAVETVLMSTSTRGRSSQRAKATRFSRSVCSSPAPPAM
jgi:hypothetical protein